MVKHNSHYFAAFCLICIAFLLWFITLDFSQFQPYRPQLDQPLQNTHSIKVETTKELISIFNKKSTPPSQEITQKSPELFLKSIPTDFKQVKDIKIKKTIFIQLMLPIIIAEQKHLRQQRFIAQQLLKDKQQITQSEVANWFSRIKKEYRINSQLSFHQQKTELLNRLDELPLTLILAQAAIESAWGTSRFAIEGNSLFGQWTFSGKNGLTPKNRSEGKTHQVKAFPSLQASIRSYLKNINRNTAYKELRDERKKMRMENKKLDAFKLAEGLHRYSQKGTEYVKIIHRLLNTSEFKNLENIQRTSG